MNMLMLKFTFVYLNPTEPLQTIVAMLSVQAVLGWLGHGDCYLMLSIVSHTLCRERNVTLRRVWLVLSI